MWLIMHYVLTKQAYIRHATRCVRAGELQYLKDKEEFLALCRRMDIASKLLMEARNRQYTCSAHSVDEIILTKNGQRRSVKLDRAIRYYQRDLMVARQEMDAFNVRYDKHCASLRRAQAVLERLLVPDVMSDTQLAHESSSIVVPGFTQQLSA